MGNSKSKSAAKPPAFVGFDGAETSQADSAVLVAVQELVTLGQSIIFEIKDYPDSADTIREVMAAASEQKEKEALVLFKEKVEKIVTWLECQKKIAPAVGKLLAVASKASQEASLNIGRMKALVDGWASMLETAFAADTEKMKATTLMNEFSFFKRLASKNPDSALPADTMMEITQFLTNANAFTSAVIAAAAETLKSEADRSFLVFAGNVFDATLQQAHETSRCAHALAMTVVVYDHVYDSGAFHKKAKINVERYITDISKSAHSEDSEQALSAMKFWSKHFKSASTKKAITTLLK
uniref:CYRIA/CYRIB Rac1 binding domain-containing protein n=1 Tax=Palpitomonas bilix TaxID=652834 RepID=A0A7S3DIW1_9EUKA|mmetsp:Transcript_39815/g.102558  ORF Transcript_39815/g.102558 Transcript_39815/m.102558 type:complete len:297 (+) Transcript_39815:238-1128(+)|eukprot:CAMPEP_0113878656 /NCGR_PEP_ID=MMETSP0780_2-20120614/6808_1 /TAXON_ID=652834 /ORGANISM="Palpitomonas bilix" /LENGTH=296 /DNA_ID=CAMNT_0000865159 /DNA_START=133 /DNA_END=1023 /DNA_ORIENTATION=- /assembly_acc=CAM_ASM_000599